MLPFTHCLDLSNPFIDTPREIERFEENKKNWDEVVRYFFRKAEVLAVHYWPRDLQFTDDRQFSAKKYKPLLPYLIDDVASDHDMHIAFYTIETSVLSILLENSTTGQTTDIFEFELRSKSEVLLHSYDNGASLFLCASNQMHEELSKMTSAGALEKL